MALYPITVNTPPADLPHIYAEDDAAIYEAIAGKDCVYSVGSMMEASVQSNNLVRIADGVLNVGGHMARIKYGDYEDLTIDNGQTGYNRNDLIVARFSTTGSGGSDAYELAVIKGEAVTGTAVDPGYTSGDLYTGAALVEMPLYRVKIQGLSIVSVDKLFTVQPTLAELNKKMEEKELANGTWYAANTTISLSEEFTKYNKIIVRTGWNSENGGVIDHEFIAPKDANVNFALPCYLRGSFLGLIVVSFNSASPKQAKIVSSNGISSGNAASGIRAIFGIL